MIDVIVQTLIIIFGVTSSLVFSSKNMRTIRWGYLVILIGQPLWFYATISNHQYGMFALSIFYTLTSLRGIYNQWFCKKDIEANINVICKRNLDLP